MSEGRDRSRPAESLLRAERLCRRQDFSRCYRKGRRGSGTHLTLFFVDNRLEGPRMGMTVSRKVGGAVARARLKRRFREIYRRWSQRKNLPSLDMVIHARPSSSRASFAELERDLTQRLTLLLERGKPSSRRE